MSEPRQFPFREVLAGDFKAKTEAEVLEGCGEPDERDSQVWTYRLGRDVPQGTLGDPKEVHFQFWFEDGTLSHAWLRLVYADNLDYQEVLF